MSGSRGGSVYASAPVAWSSAVHAGLGGADQGESKVEGCMCSRWCTARSHLCGGEGGWVQEQVPAYRSVCITWGKGQEQVPRPRSQDDMDSAFHFHKESEGRINTDQP